MMMMKRTPNNEETTTITTLTETTTNENTTNERTEDLNKSNLKRLAKKQNESFSDNVAAYVVVLRNNDNSSSRSKSSRLRKKRSTEYATLEPIDESSLEALRKTYRNSLKEITLNPNETPAQALMRYNTESIREALEKANKNPMEISAGEEVADVGGANTDGAADQQQQQHAMQQQISNSLPQTYTLSENAQYLPVTTSQETLVGNGPYVPQPLSFGYNPSPQTAAYDTSALQGGADFNNIITKYHTPGAYSNNNKYIAQNPYLQMHSPLRSVSYMDNNSVARQPYQLANYATVDSMENTAKTLVYQTPPFGFNNYLLSANAINKNLQHVSDYEMPSKNSHHTVRHLLNQNTYTNAFSPLRQAQAQSHTIESYPTESPRDSFSLNQIRALVKQQLIECCNKCKNDILQSLDETLKRKDYANTNVKSYNTLGDESHTLTYRNSSSRDGDFEYKQWLAEMSNKGYSKDHLTKQHHQDYLNDGKLNLHIEGGEDFRHEVENIFFKNNQSFKRDTTLAETETEADKETDMVTAAMTNENETEKGEEDEEDNEEEDDNEGEDDEIVVANEKQISKEDKDKNSTTNTEKEAELEPTNNKNDTIDDTKDPSKTDKQSKFTTTKTIELPETTTPSMYTLRGQFRPNKPNAMASSVKQSKKFAIYKNINKLGKANSKAKSHDKENADEKVEEIRDVLHDVSDHNIDILEENFNITTPSAAASTPLPLTTSATNLIKKTSNSTEMVEQTKSKKSSHIKSKSRKISSNLENTK